MQNKPQNNIVAIYELFTLNSEEDTSKERKQIGF